MKITASDTRSQQASADANSKGSKPKEEKPSPVRGGAEELRGPAMRDYWGGGAGPKPCEEAVTVSLSRFVCL